MEDPAEEAVVDGLAAMLVANAPREIAAKKRRESSFQVTAFQSPIAMPDLMDPQPGSSDPSTSDPSGTSGSDDTSPSSFLGTPYSTTLQFDYPFPISNAPRDPGPTPLPSALPIASSIGSAPSIVTAAVASEENSELAPATYIPSLVSSIAASPDLPVNNNLSDLRSLANRSTSSLNSTHSGHTAPGMVPVILSNASVYSVSPSSSFQSNTHLPFSVAGSPLANTNGGSMPRNKGRPHSLNLSQMPPPSLSLQTNMVKPVNSPPTVRRPKAQAVSSFASTGSDMSHESISVSAGQSRPTSGSVSSLSIASVSLLSGPGEPPIPPSLLNKLGRPRNASTASNTSSYFTANVNIYKTHNSRDFFGSPINEGGASSFASAPQTLGTDSSVDVAKPLFSPSKANFTLPRPQLGRSSSTSGHGLPTLGKPFFGRASTAQQVSTQGPNSAFQSRAYAQHLRHQQEQQKLKLQEELRKKAEKDAKEAKKKEKKEKKEKEKEKKKRRPSLSLSRTPSASSSSSSKTKASSQSKSPPSSSASQAEMFKLSPSQRNSSENAVDESEDSTSPEGMKRTKPRRRSSVRRALEKTGSIVASGFRLDISASKRTANPIAN